MFNHLEALNKSSNTKTERIMKILIIGGNGTIGPKSIGIFQNKT